MEGGGVTIVEHLWRRVHPRRVSPPLRNVGGQPLGGDGFLLPRYWTLIWLYGHIVPRVQNDRAPICKHKRGVF